MRLAFAVAAIIGSLWMSIAAPAAEDPLPECLASAVQDHFDTTPTLALFRERYCRPVEEAGELPLPYRLGYLEHPVSAEEEAEALKGYLRHQLRLRQEVRPEVLEKLRSLRIDGARFAHPMTLYGSALVVQEAGLPLDTLVCKDYSSKFTDRFSTVVWTAGHKQYVSVDTFCIESVDGYTFAFLRSGSGPLDGYGLLLRARFRCVGARPRYDVDGVWMLWIN